MERNKVIAMLERCLRGGCDECHEKGASGYPWDCCVRDQLEYDALALLKEQEARVMTMDEIKNDDVKICYFETRVGMLRGCVKELSTIPDSSTVYLVCGWKNDTYWRDFRGYGITWRCWTSRPTPEQMRDTPWEGDRDA